MTHDRGDLTPQPCICGSTDHPALRDEELTGSSSGVGFLRCPERELPRYAATGLAIVARGLCWAVDPATGLHCTEPPHGDDTDHRNGYAGRPWRDVLPAS